MEYTTIEGKKLNSTNFGCNGFRYVKVRESDCSIYIKCALFRTYSCKCTGKIIKFTNLLEISCEHNHEAEANNNEEIILSNQIKRKAEIASSNLRDVFNETCRESQGASFVTFKKLESSMYKRRRISQPKLPSNVFEFGEYLRESKYSNIHLKTVILTDQVAILFGSSYMLNMLNGSQDIQFDATFNVVPRLFYQLFTIFIYINHHAIPAVHVLMTNKSETLYNATLLALRELIVDFNPVYAMGDFEIASRNALMQNFPFVTLIGCWFHFTKALFDNIKKIGLYKLYKTNQVFRQWIRKLMALPLLPEEEIHEVYISLNQPIFQIDDSTKELIAKFRMYLNWTWITGNINLSVFHYENATNNGVESYHKSLKSYIKTPHPNIWKFMACLDNIIADNDIEFQRLLQNKETTRGANSCTKAKIEKRNECKEKYLNGCYSAIEYLNEISLTIGREHLNPYTSFKESEITNENEVEENIYPHLFSAMISLFLKVKYFVLNDLNEMSNCLSLQSKNILIITVKRAY